MDINLKQDIVNHSLEFMQTLVNYQGDFMVNLSNYDVRQQFQCILEVGADLSFIKKRINIQGLEPLNRYEEVSRLDYAFLKDTVCTTNLQGHAVVSGYGDIIIKDEQNFLMFQDFEHYILVLDNRILEYSIDNVLQFLSSVVRPEAQPMNKNLSKRFLQDFKNICLCTIFLDDFPQIPVLYKSRINSDPRIVQLFRAYKKQALDFPKGKQIIAYNCFWERLENIKSL
ncbi:MAG: hypothetical protein ACI4WH_02395 [Oscillospiraceae bacterium]